MYMWGGGVIREVGVAYSGGTGVVGMYGMFFVDRNSRLAALSCGHINTDIPYT